MNSSPRRRRPTRSVRELNTNQAARRPNSTPRSASNHTTCSGARPSPHSPAPTRSVPTTAARKEVPQVVSRHRVSSHGRAVMLAKRRRRAQLQALLSLLALVLILSLLAVGVSKCASGSGVPSETDPPAAGTETDESTGAESNHETTGAPNHETDAETGTDTGTPPTVPAFTIPAGIESRCLLLIDRETGAIIAEKNADEITYPASITKIMTVLLALEHITDPSETVTITADLLDRLYALGASRAGFSAGEEVIATDLMYASLLPSGADGSIGLAELVAGSEEAFVKLMNDKATELGMHDTHFVNATGLHDSQHYSTCTDLAILLEYALENESFRTIFTTSSYRSTATDEHPSGIRMKSTMRQYLSECQIERDYLLGGKTGFTSKAGLCLASLAEHDGKEYILITLGAGDGVNYPRYQVQDAVKMFDALFENLA